MSDAAHPSPHRARVSLSLLLFGVMAAPGFWIAQIVFGYAASAILCYPDGHPLYSPPDAPAVAAGLFAFDIAAAVIAVAGGIAALLCWRRVSEEKPGGPDHAIEIGEGRARFMAVWGIFSSLWFFAAIVFNAIATQVVPLCLH